METHFENDQVKLYQADVLAWALWYKSEIDDGRAEPFHAVFADPPYSLGETPDIVKLLTAWLGGADFDGFSKGFMGKLWDVLPAPEYWKALYDIVYPGAYMFLFSGTRTADLMGIAARLGGWEPFDRVANFGWVQGQGMKKGTDVSKALDKEAGAEREVVGRPSYADGTSARMTSKYTLAGQDLGTTSGKGNFITAPATPLAKLFNDYGTGIAPKHEPVLLFRKPRDGRTFAQCAREFGSGGLNVGGCRVGTDESLARQNKGTDVLSWGGTYGAGDNEAQKRQDAGLAQLGRWPPNVTFSHTPHTHICETCNGSGCGECHGQGAVGGCRQVGTRRVGSGDGVVNQGGTVGPAHDGYTRPGASMFTHKQEGQRRSYGAQEVADWHCVEGWRLLPPGDCPECGAEQEPRLFEEDGEILAWGNVVDFDGYEKKCQECQERYDVELERVDCAVRLLDEMAGARKTGMRSTNERKGGWANNSKLAHGGGYQDTSSSAARFFPNHDWSLEIAEALADETPFFYCAKAGRGERDAGVTGPPQVKTENWNESTELADRMHGKTEYRNFHPTIKPLTLTRWLATLCRPPLDLKPRICIPYSGSGSEVIGAILAGWSEIHAIERELEYCDIQAARIVWWSKWSKLTSSTDPVTIRRLGEAAKKDERQIDLFDAMGL